MCVFYWRIFNHEMRNTGLVNHRTRSLTFVSLFKKFVSASHFCLNHVTSSRSGLGHVAARWRCHSITRRGCCWDFLSNGWLLARSWSLLAGLFSGRPGVCLRTNVLTMIMTRLAISHYSGKSQQHPCRALHLQLAATWLRPDLDELWSPTTCLRTLFSERFKYRTDLGKLDLILDLICFKNLSCRKFC